MMLTTQQAAERLSVHPETIRRLVKAGKLKAVALSATGRARLRIDEKELQTFIDGPANPDNSGLKTFIFEVDGTEYQARNYVSGIFIDPVLPDDFWTAPINERSPEYLKHWEAMPFVLTDDGFYKAYCLDGGAWDRPSLLCGFDTLDKAIDYLKEKYIKKDTLSLQ
jgi:excisionase family DNA binding protein